MQQMFLNRYFPVAKSISIKREITSIMQFQEESLAEYCERFSNLCTTCPDHQISEPRLLVYWYEGLLYKDKVLVDAATRGPLLDKTPTEARKLLYKLAGNDPDDATGE
ncbi:hypothetical protein V8G54_023832 [Vigna mungo]|uniref:Retrotransposon gag domain-containing protein n=1 Tax=Vigna mungo TaxID=3915 RepID=A0AAQ3N5N1_VIGMU